jgi:hypothetical protein
MTVEHDHLAVEPMKRAQPEVAVLAKLADRHLATVQPFDQRSGCGHLEQRPVLHLEVIGQGRPDEVINRFTTLPAAVLDRLVQGPRDPASQRGCGGGQVGHDLGSSQRNSP